MTPLITEMIQWADKPELSTWFDLGNVTNTEGRRVEANQVLRLPYDLTSIVGRDKNGEKFALLLKLGNESVTVAGFTKTDYRGIGAHGAFGKTLEPFTYMATPEGMRYFKGDSQVSDDEVKQGFRMVCACLLKLHECTEAHQPTVRANSITNKRRIAKGKPPLIYDWHTVKLEPNKPNTEHQGGTHATPRRHQCRGHCRNCKSGKRVWVKDCWKGDASKGTVFKDYEAKK